MTHTHQKSRIPEFKNHQEEADYWDTHDTADYEDEFTPVTIHFAKDLSQKVAIRLDTPTLNAIHTEAHRKGIGSSTFIRMLIKEHFQTTHRKVSAA